VAARLALCGGPAAFLLSLAAIHHVTVDGWDAVITERAVAIVFLVGLACSETRSVRSR
jgi:hypothetical protein